jgi:hypothetical protein
MPKGQILYGMRTIKSIYKWCTATRLRKILSSILAFLIFLTSIRYLFLKPKIVLADSTLGFNEGYGTTVNDDNGNVSGTLSSGGGTNGGPTKIDDAGDPGAMSGSGRQVVRTSSGTLYAFINDGGSCEIWKSSDGTSWTEQDSANNPSCSTSGSVVGMAIDSSNNLHLLYESVATEDPTYVKFTTSSDTFGTPEAIFDASATSYNDIAVDSNNIPHVVFYNSAALKYTNRVGGSWDATPVAIETVSILIEHASIAISEDNIPEIAYPMDADGDLAAAVGNQNDASSFTLQDVDTNIVSASGTTSTSIAVDSSGNTWIGYVDENGATDFVTLIKHNDADAWTTWQTPVTNSNGGKEPTIAAVGTAIYIFYQDANNDVAYDKYTGSWSGASVLQTGTFQDVKVKWSYNFDNQQSTQLDYLYSDATDISWASLSLASGTTPTWKTEDLCKFGKCLYFSNGSVSFGDDADLDFVAADNFTLEGWFRSPDISSQKTIIAKYNGTAGYKVYLDSNGYLVFGIDDDSAFTPDDSSSTSTTAFDDNKWHFFSAVKTGTTSITIYVDGIQYQTDSSIAATGTLANADTFYIGIDGDGSSNAFSGFLDEVKVYRSARSSTEIKADLTSNTPSRGTSASFGPDQSYLSNGLIAYWSLDENTGTSATDSSGNSNTETLSAANWNTGKYGSSWNGDGGKWITTGADDNDFDFTGTDDFTYSMWIKSDSSTNPTNNEFLVDKENATAGYGIYFSTNGFPVFGTDDDSSFTPDDFAEYQTDIYDATWHHITAVKKGTTNIKIYVDGVLRVTTPVTATGSLANTDFLTIGAQDNVAANDEFTGDIDDIRVYRRALSDSEVASLYNWAPGPIGYWNFDENTGTTSVFDKSTNGFTGTMEGSIPSSAWVPGKFGSSLTFDGSDDDILISDNATLDITGDFSVSAWFARTGASNEVVVSKFSTVGGGGYALLVGGSGEVYCRTDNGTTNTDSFTATGLVNTDSVWHHLEVARSGTSCRVWVDGIDKTLTTGTHTTLTANANGLTIGDEPDNSDPAGGKIDDVKLYNYARTSSQIVEDMNGGHTAPGSPIGSTAGYWKFDEGYSTTAFDNSINANNLTLNTATSAWTNNGKFGKAWDGEGIRFISRTNDNDFDVGTADFSFSFWFKSDNSGGSGTQYIINRASATIAGFAVYGNSSGNIVFGVDDDTTWGPDATVTSTANLYDQTWHHIVARKTGTSSLDLFVDGKLNATTTAGIPTGSLSNDLTFYLADRDGTNNGDEFIGDIDEVKFYLLALTENAAKVEYNRGSQSSLGSTSTDSSGNATWSTLNEYCPPGQSTTCTGPIAEWKLDENTGTTAYDTSTNGINGTLDTATTWTTGVKGSALKFINGSNSNVEVDDNATLDFGASSDFSIEAWIYRIGTVDADAIVYKRDSATCDADSIGYNFYIGSGGDVNFEACDGVDEYHADGATNITTTGWHHVVGVWDDDSTTNTTVYLDGVEDSSSPTGTLSLVGDISNGFDFCIGSETSGTPTTCSSATSGMDGYIDDVRVYNYALTPAQIAWHFNRGGPVGWWKMDENTGTTTNDSSGKNYNSSAFTGNTTWATGKFNTGLTFDGTDDAVRIVEGGGIDVGGTASSYTISAWINTTQNVSITASILEKDDSSTPSPFHLWLDSSEFACFQLDDSASHSPSTCGSKSLSDGAWHMVTAIRDVATDTLYLYVDGYQVNSTNDTTTTTTVNNDDVSLGNGGISYTSRDYSGVVDDARIYNYALTEQQIKLLYNGGAAVDFHR